MTRGLALALAAAVAAIVCFAMLPPPQAAAGCLLGWALLWLADIDIRLQILPDPLTLGLAAAGLAATYLLAPHRLADHVIGAAAGFAVFVAVAAAYRRLRGRDGLGGGDVKLMAAAGAWVSWEGLASLVLLASLAALAFVLLRPGQRAAAARLPFGPFLGGALWLVWLKGPIHV